MKIQSVVLDKDKRLAGDLPKKAFRSEGTIEVHYDPDLQVVAIFKQGYPDAIIVPVCKCEELRLHSDMAQRIMAPARSK